MTTKVVVDSGALRSRSLFAYLTASPRNFAVISDFATLEILKGNPQTNLRESLLIISKFPKQIILLKPNAKISRMSLRSKGFQRRLQDDKQTRGFGDFCRKVSAGAVPEEILSHNIAARAAVARHYLDRLAKQTESVRAGLSILSSRISAEDLTAIRHDRAASPAFTEQVERDILGITALHFRNVIRTPLPRVENAMFSFPFRYAVCSYVMSLNWIKDSGHQNAKLETLMNDYVDMTYCAYATFFDGLLTNDEKLREMFRIACWVLKNVFQVSPH